MQYFVCKVLKVNCCERVQPLTHDAHPFSLAYSGVTHELINPY